MSKRQCSDVDVGGDTYVCCLTPDWGDCTIGYVHLDVDVGADMGFADRLTTYPTIKIETGAISNLM
jgi:hypothetical protein